MRKSELTEQQLTFVLIRCDGRHVNYKRLWRL